MDNISNLPFRGNTEVGKLLYNLNCEVMEVHPTSIRNDDGKEIEVDESSLKDGMYRTMHQSLCKYYMKLNKEIFAELGRDSQDWESYLEMSPRELLTALYRRDIINYGSHDTLINKYMGIKFGDVSISELVDEMIKGVGMESSTPMGRFSKRVAGWLFHNLGVKLTSEELTYVGNIYNNCKVNIGSQSFKIRITNNFNWSDGDYGKDDSCWWGCYRDSKDTLHYFGGFGVLFYRPDDKRCDHNTGYGRTWIYPISDTRLIAFNSYGNEGKVAAAVIARMMENLTGNAYKYCKREVENEARDNNYPYINGNNLHNNSGGSKCYVILPIDETIDRSTIYIDMDRKSGIFGNPQEVCCRCGDTIDEDDAFHNEQGDTYCESCYNDTYYACSNCGCESETSEAHRFQDSWGRYCEYCYSEQLAGTCDYCGNDYIDISNLVTTNDTHETYCVSCANRGRAGVQHCMEHGEYYRNTCETCANETPEEILEEE